MNIFISMPMRNLTPAQIHEVRKAVEAWYVDTHRGGEHYEFLDQRAPADKHPTPAMALAYSLDMLANQADAVVFVGPYHAARGCEIEMRVCEEYGIPHISLHPGNCGNQYVARILEDVYYQGDQPVKCYAR